jgi:hypothetical protein
MPVAYAWQAVSCALIPKEVLPAIRNRAACVSTVSPHATRPTPHLCLLRLLRERLPHITTHQREALRCPCNPLGLEHAWDVDAAAGRGGRGAACEAHAFELPPSCIVMRQTGETFSSHVLSSVTAQSALCLKLLQPHPSMTICLSSSSLSA